VNREAIFSALFALLQTTPGVNTFSRRLKAFTEVTAADQPAIFLLKRNEVANVVTKVPTRWELSADVVLYANTDAAVEDAPATALNPLLDYITTVLFPDPVNNEQTLGGLVYRCRISGSIQIFEGDLSNEAVAIIPISMLVP
jgi:hypothetical protein